MNNETPDCPNCGMPPWLALYHQSFCDNDDCIVVMWDPSKTLAEIRASDPKIIDIDLGDGS